MYLLFEEEALNVIQSSSLVDFFRNPIKKMDVTRVYTREIITYFQIKNLIKNQNQPREFE